MSSLRKSVTQLLGLAPMALIVHISTAAAANPLNDRADQQRAWLSGKSATVSAPVSAPRTTKVARSTGDAQQQAREMLLGLHAGTPSGPRNLNVARSTGDAQQQAREMLLGLHAGTPSGPRNLNVVRSTGDAQQQAREMLLGMHAGTPSGPAVASDKTEPQERAVAHSDRQTAVR
jgi:hypothetical protein